MKKFAFVFILLLNTCVFAQLSLPRESQRQEISQTVGDTKISIVYHRPNTKNRKIWGCNTKDVVPVANNLYECLVPYGQVWRAGANENTTIEFSRDVTINGQALPAGKYGFHVIPTKTEWTLIFSKDNAKWGSFTYEEKNDALRVKVRPAKSEMRETLLYEIDNVTANSARVALRWEKVAVPFTVDIGDIHGRMLSSIRDAIKARKADDFRALNQGANYVRTFKLAANYTEALGWLDESIKARETFTNLSIKARILAETGKTAEAIALGEKAVQVGKAATPPVNTAEFDRILADWKAKK